MTPFPAPNRLHVWWARRPLVASRAAVLASLLPSDADRTAFLHAIGIHGDPVAAKVRIAEASRQGERLGADAYGYPRAFGHAPTEEIKDSLVGKPDGMTLLDPTAGGGSVPFEALRLGLAVRANDLNTVAALIEVATVAWPATHGERIESAFAELGGRFVAEVKARLAGTFPDEPENDMRPDGYLYARTIACLYCAGLVPLSPNWRLAPGGVGVRLVPELRAGPGTEGRVCGFEIVERLEEQSAGTVKSRRCTYIRRLFTQNFLEFFDKRKNCFIFKFRFIKSFQIKITLGDGLKRFFRIFVQMHDNPFIHRVTQQQHFNLMLLEYFQMRRALGRRMIFSGNIVDCILFFRHTTDILFQ